MDVRARALGIATVLVAVVGLSGAVAAPVAASTPTGVSDGSSRSVAYLILDDRDLSRRTTGWSSVASTTAFRSTLTCASRRGETLRLPERAEAGGGIRVWTGPGRGSIAVLVGGTVVVRASTVSSSFSYTWVRFRGTGRVDVRITSADRRVCIDSARLVLPDVVPGG